MVTIAAFADLDRGAHARAGNLDVEADLGARVAGAPVVVAAVQVGDDLLRQVMAGRTRVARDTARRTGGRSVQATMTAGQARDSIDHLA